MCTDIEKSLQPLTPKQIQILQDHRMNFLRIQGKCAKTYLPMDNMIFLSAEEQLAWNGNQKSLGIDHPFCRYCPNFDWINSLSEGIHFLVHCGDKSMIET